MPVPLAAAAVNYGVPLVASALGGLFRRKKKAPAQPSPTAQTQVYAAQARQEAATARRQDSAAQMGYAQSLARYKARMLNPQTYRTQDQLAAGGAAADAAFGAESDQARTAAALARAGVPVGSAAAGAYTGAENQRTADLALARRAILSGQIQRQDAAEREVLGLEAQQADTAYNRSRASSAELLELLRLLSGDQLQQQQITAARRSSDAGLTGQLAAAAGGIIAQSRKGARA
jgi:hypothetical protein